MVLPPSGSERGQVGELVEIEHLLLDNDFKVISSGITGRVVTSGDMVGAAPMSDLERALVLARTSHADALLQIARVTRERSYRAFVWEGAGPYREVQPGTPVSAADVLRVHETRFQIQARVIDTADGAVTMAIDLTARTSDLVPSAVPVLVGGGFGNTHPSDIETDTPERQRDIVQLVFSALVNKLKARTPG
jgi:hypothetical protein